MRFRILSGVITALMASLIGYFWFFQCVRTPFYRTLSERNRVRLVPLSAPRGSIYDRDGMLLVGSRLAYDCAVIPQEFVNDDAERGRAGRLLGIGPDAIARAIREDFTAPFASIPIKKDIGQEEAIRISEQGIGMPGLVIETRPVRHYVLGSAGSHLFGYLGLIDGREYKGLKNYGYRIRDKVGRGGLEKQYNEYLKGTDGGMQIEVNSRGRQIRLLGIREPRNGLDLEIALDRDLQLHVDGLMEGRKGAAIVMESGTGGILALVSKPNFDPNIFVSSGGDEAVRGILRRADYPLINRSIGGAYPPGSVFKIVTSSAALDSGRISGETVFTCGGAYTLGNRRFRCWKKGGHGAQRVKEGLKNSCNVFFYNTGRRVGVDMLSEYASRFGLGGPTGIDLPGEVSGIVPDRAWKRIRMKEPWYEGETLNYAIGQGYLLVTPLQLLSMMNVVASDGMLVTPHVAERIGGIEITSYRHRDTGIGRDVLAAVRQGLTAAVGDRDGTARHAGVSGMSIAGKTGTAQVPSGDTHAWFAGFSPAEGARVTLLVFLEHGGHGGGDASVIASKIFEKLKELEYL